MLRKVPIGIIGATVEGLEAGIFAMIANESNPGFLFKPLGVGMLAATIPGPCLEDTTAKRIFRSLGILTAAGVSVAIFCFEGPTAAGIFTVTLAASEAIMVAELLHKKLNNELTNEDIFEFTLKSSKLLNIGLTINLGGTGKIFDLIGKSKSLPIANRITSGIAAGLAGLGATIGLFRVAQTVKKSCTPVVESEPEYHPLNNTA